MQSVFKIVPALGALSLAAACGSGGSSNTVAFTSFSNVPADGTVVINGEAISSNYTQNLVSGEVTASAVSGPNPATLRSRFAGSVPQDVIIEAPGANAAIDLASGAVVPIAGRRIVAVSADGRTVYISEDVAPAYEYQTYGTWLTQAGTGAGAVGAGSFGAQTPVSSLPGSASYSGSGLGFARDAAGQGFYTDFDVAATTDFSTITVTSSNTFAENVTTEVISSVPTLDFTGSGPVTGNRFSATIASTDTSGTASGTFYGPNAEEFGGTFDTTGPGGIVHFGAFGGQ
ncbi:MAG: transferrin-binding protein-like solute binding protein [Pseudomonadota bacterium]